MVLNSSFSYPPLVTPSQTRIVLLAPGKEDAPIHCFHLVIDLDADWDLPSPSQTPPPSNLQSHSQSYITARYKNSTATLSFMTPPLHMRSDEDGGGLHPFQKYTALSYVWGDQKNPREIVLNGHSFQVGHSLYTALRRLQKKRGVIQLDPDPENTLEDRFPRSWRRQVASEGVLLWIDAMCINQANLHEREAQVKLMSRIYSQAVHVHAELEYTSNEDVRNLVNLLQKIRAAGSICESSQPSPSEDDSAALSKMVSSIEKNWKVINSKSKLRRLAPAPRVPKASVPTLEDYGLPPATDAVWGLWRNLMKSVYFGRLWIIQEFALADRISIWFGNVGLDPEMIRDCLVYLKQYSTNRSSYLTVDNATGAFDSATESGFFAFIRLMRQRDLRHGENTLTTKQSRLLELLALSREAQATDQRDKIYGMLGLASDRDRFMPLVSYSKPTREVFKDFCQRFVEVGQGIEMLYQVDSGTSELPTWIPDWSRTSVESSIYNAQTGREQHAASQLVPPTVQIIESDMKLVVNGGLVDTIARLSPPLTRKSTHATELDFYKFVWQGGHLTLDFSRYPTGEDAPDVLLSTLICARLGSKMPNEVSRLRRSLWSVIGEMTALAARSESAVSDWAPHTRDIMQAGFPKALGRCWCLTENGYLGLVPGGTQVGDRVCIFYGGALPFLVRPCSAKPDTDFRLVGHGYFHGLMHGEAFDLKTFKPQHLTLV